MDDNLSIPKAAKRVRLTPAALYAAATRGDLQTTEAYGRIVVSLAEVLRYKRETKVGRRPKPNGRKAR